MTEIQRRDLITQRSAGFPPERALSDARRRAKMLARRFALPPINEAHYDPRGVPSADRQMTNSTIVRPTREEWLAMLGELVQMCNECVRRKAQSRKDEVSATPCGLVRVRVRG